MDLSNIVVLGLAAGGLLTLLQLSDALVMPLRLLSKLRLFRGNLKKIKHLADLTDVFDRSSPWVSELIQCPFCLGFWISIVVGMQYWTADLSMINQLFAIYAICLITRGVIGHLLMLYLNDL